ncbi:pseudaminic acid cytidylyltransferase, partial [Nonlabens tegetincola]|uniref:pseudaminic acid cytidylyltransferase n=1 Tax=Nonlabens tegetincola TaxID=323273 RepID=UPI0030C804FB
MSKLCIIPARGGSKRIPRKNIKSFLGKPIIAYSIDAALNSKLFDEVMVSTDDEEIAEIAMKYGATVPFYRSEENSNDHATTFDVLKEVIEEYKLRYKKEFKYACCIYPTAPFVTSKRLSESLDTLIKNDFDTVFPIIKFGFPIQRALKLSESGKIEFFNKEHKNTRSQDLESTFHDAVQFYWFNVIQCLEAKTLIT